MMRRCFLMSIVVVSTSAFTTTPLHNLHNLHCRPLTPITNTASSSSTSLHAESGGGGAVATPGTKQETKTITKQTTKSQEKQKSKKKAKAQDPYLKDASDFEDAPMFRLYLLGDEEYEQTHTIERMVDVVEDLKEGDAASLFTTAQQIGEAFLGSYPKELAELYAEQLTRSEPIIYADVREDENENKKKN